MTTTTLTAITPASGHPPVIVSGADVVASVSANAWRVYWYGWQRCWVAWAQAADVRTILAEPEFVARYAIPLHHTGAAMSTIRQAIAAIQGPPLGQAALGVARVASNQMTLHSGRLRSPGGSNHEMGDSWPPPSEILAVAPWLT